MIGNWSTERIAASWGKAKDRFWIEFVTDLGSWPISKITDRHSNLMKVTNIIFLLSDSLHQGCSYENGRASTVFRNPRAEYQEYGVLLEYQFQHGYANFSQHKVRRVRSTNSTKVRSSIPALYQEINISPSNWKNNSSSLKTDFIETVWYGLWDLISNRIIKFPRLIWWID